MSQQLTATNQKKLDVMRNTFISQKFQSDLREALPEGLRGERFIKVALGSFRRNPKLLECTPASIVKSVLEAAGLGLETDGVLGFSYLVPYKNECQLIVGYRGLVELIRRSGSISVIKAGVVRTGDDFDFMDVPPMLRHRSSEEEETHRPITHVYAWVKMRDGSEDFVCWSKAKVDAHRRQFSRTSSGPWDTSYEWMAKKTVIRQLVKLLPVSVELTKLANREEYIEGEVLDSVEVPQKAPKRARLSVLSEAPADNVPEPAGEPEPAPEPATTKPPRKRRTADEMAEEFRETCKARFGKCQTADVADAVYQELKAKANTRQKHEVLESEARLTAEFLMDANDVPVDVQPDGELLFATQEGVGQ